jgi:hypothetical protein
VGLGWLGPPGRKKRERRGAHGRKERWAARLDRLGFYFKRKDKENGLL